MGDCVVLLDMQTVYWLLLRNAAYLLHWLWSWSAGLLGQGIWLGLLLHNTMQQRTS